MLILLRALPHRFVTVQSCLQKRFTSNLSICCNTYNSFLKDNVKAHVNSASKLVRFPFILQFSRRDLYGWLNAIFNKYDGERVKEVGANRACAEWLLRCGAAVKWESQSTFLRDYNSLPIGGPRLKIEEVDATDSAVMYIGFQHFRDCDRIRRLVLHNCIYLDDDAVRDLRYLSNSLEELQISNTGGVTHEGLKMIAKLPKLKSLVMYGLPAVQDKNGLVQYLKESMPNCNISFSKSDSVQ